MLAGFNLEGPHGCASVTMHSIRRTYGILHMPAKDIREWHMAYVLIVPCISETHVVILGVQFIQVNKTTGLPVS